MVVDDIKTKGTHQKDRDGVLRKEKDKGSSGSVASGHTYQQQKRLERLRMELTHVLSLVADVVDHAAYRRNEAIMNGVMVYVTEMGRFLSDPETMFEVCGDVGGEGGKRGGGAGRGMGGGYMERGGRVGGTGGYGGAWQENDHPDRYMPFHIRLALFKLFEQWCGFGRFAQATREREAHMMLSVLENVKDIRERGVLTSAMEQQRKGVEVASLKAMSVLCKGPISRGAEGERAGGGGGGEKGGGMFEWSVLENWIDSVFGSPDESVHPVARSALEALLVHNRANTQVLSDVIRKCYSGPGGSVIQMGYFMALVDCFVREGGYVWDATPVYALALLKSGDVNLGVRRGAVRLLRVLEDRHWGRENGGGQYVFGGEGEGGGGGPVLVPKLIDLMGGPGGVGVQVRDGEEGGEEEGMDDDGGMAMWLHSEDEHATYEAAAISSSLPIVHKYAQAMVSARLASERPEIAFDMLSEMVKMIDTIAAGNPGSNTDHPMGVRDLLICMVPWVRNVELSFIAEEGENGERSALQSQSQPRNRTQRSSSPNREISTSRMILTNLFYLTVKYGDDYLAELENIWSQLVSRAVEENDLISQMDAAASAAIGEDEDDEERMRRMRIGEESLRMSLNKNVNMVVEFLLGVGVEKRNPKFVVHAKKIMVYLARTAACGELVEALVKRMTPKSFVPEVGGDGGGSSGNGTESTVKAGLGGNERKENPFAEAHVGSGMYMANLDDVLVTMPKRPAFSKGQLACVLLVDMSIEVGPALTVHLPLLLHAVFVQLDHFMTLMCEQNRILLMNLIQGIVPRDVCGPQIDAVHNALIVKEGKRLWPYEDVTPTNRTIESPEQLTALVADVLDLFSVVDPELVQRWGEVALTWGTSCPVRHVASRSLQIYRALSPAFNQRMVGDLLNRLAGTVSDATEEIQGFALEILATLHDMVDSLDAHQLILFPQFFWAGVAMIHSPFEWEYLEGVELLAKVVSKVDLNDPQKRNILLMNQPTRWKGRFGGLQPLLLRGLVSRKTEPVCLRLLDTLVVLENDALVDPTPARILFSVLANLPHLLQGMEVEGDVEGIGGGVGSRAVDEDGMLPLSQCLTIAEDLSVAAEQKGCPGLARLLSSYAKRRFRSKEDFLRQFVGLVRDKWFPAYSTATLQFLTGLLENASIGYRKRTLRALKVFLPVMQGSPMADGQQGVKYGTGYGDASEEELMRPLLELLPSELAEDALEVLDEAMAGGMLSGETNFFWLVFGGKSIHKVTKEATMPEGDGKADQWGHRSGSEGTGWRIRDQPAMAKVTRYNMSSVGSTCGGGHDILSGGRKGSIYSNYSNTVDFADGDVGRGGSLVRAVERAGWPMDELNGNLLEALQDLDAFFGRTENFISHMDSEVIKINGHSIGSATGEEGSDKDTATGSRWDSSTGISSGSEAASNRIRRSRLRKASTASAASEVSYSAESLGAPLTRDTSLASLFVDNILGHPSAPMSAAALNLDMLDGSHAPLGSDAAHGTALTPARRLLSHPGTFAHVSFRLHTAYGDVVKDAEFEHWVKADIAAALHVLPASVTVEKVGDGKLSGGEGTIVTLVVNGVKESGDGGVSSAAYAEELVGLLVGAEEDGERAESLGLRKGVVMSAVDLEHKPEIVIGFMGIDVPYVAEGLRYELPQHAQTGPHAPTQPARAPQSVTSAPNTPTTSSSSPNLDALSPLTDETAVEALKIFPASFELVMQLHEDWAEFVGEHLESGGLGGAGGGSMGGAALQQVYEILERRRVEDEDGSGAGKLYWPPLVEEDENGKELLDVSRRLLSYQQMDAKYVKDFMDQRQQRLTALNSRLNVYLPLRQVAGDLSGGNGGEVGGEGMTGKLVELALELQYLYMDVLHLQALLEGFLSWGQERRVEEEREVKRCIGICKMGGV
ncbi:Cell morphogenesis protein PAG1 [Rhizophlyctis rosea]|nr:Cell morphogenesis protein PAG1 [Rhizophlyctis rosea]